MQALNIELFGWINGSHPPAADFLLWLARYGSLLCAFALGWAFCFRPKERLYAVAILLAAAVTAMAVHVLAPAIDAPRPFMLGLGVLRLDHGPRGSMPSAHAAVMFTVALLLLMRPSLRIAGIVALVLAGITGWARVYAGVHFPLDIAGGLLLAGLVVIGTHVVLRLFDLWPKLSSRKTLPASPRRSARS